MKYKAIYSTIHASDGEITYEGSSWHKDNPNIVEHNRPLWIVLESRRANLRLWVTHTFGKLQITTAQLDLNCKSPEYSKSYRYYGCKNQGHMATLLRKILKVDSQGT